MLAAGVSQDVLNQEMLHSRLSLTFASPDDLTSYLSHERHAAFAGTFMAALEKVVVIDKPPPARSDEASDLI
jgi:hypothetical protein